MDFDCNCDVKRFEIESQHNLSYLVTNKHSVEFLYFYYYNLYLYYYNIVIFKDFCFGW